ncbi:MAG: hypothetical protein IJZ53_13930 [Tyzzerella sp.]|nr:hypothetical protein [Tyzzerella sp.]
MKERLKNNLGLKIMALFFAIFLWWAVVNIDDPIEQKKFYTEVGVVNPEVITNEGKSYQISDNTKTVVVTVEARRKVLEEIKSGNIVATADMRELQGTSVPIRITINGFEGKYEKATANPQNIQVKVEETQQKTFPITPVTTGSVRDGYVVAGLSVSPKSVDISGPESVVGKISKVVARVDVSELSGDVTKQTTLVYYDAADNVIEKTNLSSNCDANGVDVTVTVWKTKTVSLGFDTSGIVPGDGYIFDSIEVEPKEVEIAASQEVLTTVTKLEIKAEELQKTDMTKNEDIVVDISKYLPEGVILADSDASNVLVKIILEQVGTKTISLPVRSVRVEGLSDKLQIEYGPTQALELVFEGANEVLQTLTAEKITATIDLTAFKEEGTFEVPVTITSIPEGCAYTGDVKVQIILSQKEAAGN